MTASNVLPNTLLPVVLSGQYQTVIDTGLPYDFLIEGIPFRLDPSDEDPYLRDLVEDQKDQFDNSREAGEQSFGRWWLRSQSTFHGGAGQRYIDSGDPDISRLRFESSSYAYPFEPGQVTIASALALEAVSRKRVEQVTWSGVQRLATMSSVDNKVYVSDLPGLGATTTITLGATGTCQDMTSDGENLFVAVADKVWKIDSTGSATEISSQSFSGLVTLAYAKQRLILCLGNKVYAVDATATTSTPPVLHYTNPSTAWAYTCVADGPNGIYLVGRVGPRSEVQSIALTESGGTLILGAPTVQMKLPEGELAQQVMFYTNSQFVLTTSNGIRAGVFTPYGQPQFGGLMAAGNPTYGIAAAGSLVYVGGSNKVFWIDLATPVDQTGRYAYALYGDQLNTFDTTDTVADLTVYQAGGLDYLFGAMSSGQLLTQTSHTKTQPAQLTTSWMRFGTVEPKQPAYIRVDGEFPVVAGVAHPLTIAVEADSGQVVSFPIEGGANSYEFALFGLPASQAFRCTFTLRDTGAGHGVLLRSWQIKALPVPKRYKEIVLPLMCYDSEVDFHSQEHGYDGFCLERLADLEALAEDSPVVTVWDRLADISYQAVIRRCQFNQRHAPTETDAMGGKITLVLRLV